MKIGNRKLLKIWFKTEYDTYYTKKSLLKYICNRLKQKYEIYHSSGKNGSIYAYLKNTSKNDLYISLRVSDHDVLSRGFIKCLGGADEEIVYQNHHNLDDLDEMIEELYFDIKDYVTL
jgi:hypothetical protein